MNRAGRFRPVVCPMEDRVALSLSLSGLIHSALPFIPDHAKPIPHKTNPATAVTNRIAEAHASALARHAARVAKIQANQAGRVTAALPQHGTA